MATRLLNPSAEVRAAGGREYHLRSMQPLALYAIDSLFASGYLTTGGQDLQGTIQMIEDMGFSYTLEGEENLSPQDQLLSSLARENCTV